MSNNAFIAEMSTDSICVGADTSACLSDWMENMETAVGGKAESNHTHTAANIGAAEATHTHAQSDITGLEARLTAMEADIEELQAAGDGSGVTPMLVASMHLGKLDNNNGAELSSTTRICSDPFAVENGKSYWQVNDKAVNMYVLLYDADEVFLEYMGSFASGAEIAVTNASAAYMRLGSLLGEYDLTNEFRIYDVDPESGASGETAVDAYTKEEADTRFAAAAHTHDGYATTDHTHDGYAASSHTHTAEDITGLPSSVDAYSKTESDSRYATVGHTHDGYAAANHTHSDYAASGHTHTPASIGAAAYNHEHNYASSGHSHTPTEVGAVPATGGTFTGEVEIPYGLGTGSVYPFDSGSYSIGSSENRYYSTYLRVNPNVSSDERLKRDIAVLDAEALAAFINGLPVVSYNYKDDAAGMEKKIGVIAQDVISADSEIARFFVEQDKKGFYGLRPADFVFPLIAAVQVLSRKVAELEGK